MVTEQGLGSSPFISVSDMSQWGGGRPVVAYKHEYIDIHIPPDRFSKMNAAAHAKLDAEMEQHKAILGDSEKVMEAAMDVQDQPVDTLVWTVPTSIAGVLALLELCPELSRERVLDDDQADAILESVAEALHDLHPSARLASGDGLMKIEHWHRRHALSLASMLPDGRDDAMAVLDCVRELVTAFLQVDAPEPAKAKIVTLVRDCQELSV
jgi:hypothetical protein